MGTQDETFARASSVCVCCTVVVLPSALCIELVDVSPSSVRRAFCISRMVAQTGKKMPKKKVLTTKRKSEESRKREMARNKKNAEKMKQLEQVPTLLKKLDKVYIKNLTGWLSNLSTAAHTEIPRKEVEFGTLLVKFGLVAQTFIQVIDNSPSKQAQNCDAGIEPTKKPEQRIRLILHDKMLLKKSWLNLLEYLLQPLEKNANMRGSHVDRAETLLDLGFAQYVDPAIKPKDKMDGDFRGDIRKKLQQQRSLAEAKQAEEAEKQKEKKTLEEKYTRFGVLEWSEHCRPPWHNGFLASKCLKVIFEPFELSDLDLASLLSTPTTDALDKPLPDMHRAVLLLYTSAHYQPLNKALRTTGNGPIFAKYANFLVHLTNALCLLPPLQEADKTVYRGTTNMNFDVKEKGTFVWPAPTSASKNMCVANGFIQGQGILFVIRALTGKSIKHFSKYPHEDEVLFPPNAQFEVTRRTDDKAETATALAPLKQHQLEKIKTTVFITQYA